MTQSPTLAYFGRGLVDRAVADYFARHGLTEEVKAALTLIASSDEDGFFEIVDQYVMRTQNVTN